MSEKVKLRGNIILNGQGYVRDSIIDREVVEGTRFDSEEFLITKEEPEFDEPPFNPVEEIDINMMEKEPPPEAKVKVKHIVSRKKLVRKG
jgi:hypothetical protein